MTAEVTRTIGRYHVIAKLGQGGMANVFLTVAPGPAGVQKLLVVKELRAELAHDDDIRTMFLDEARLAARLNHPNVVQTYEVGEDGGHHFIAMEYLEGQPFNRLRRRSDRASLPLEAHLRILADALGGLHYAHELTDFDGTPLHVVHRDMSPHNLFVTYDGQVKVVDFGIAKAASARGSTKNGMFKGKVTYASPEQALATPIDRRADVFAVGVMLWEALTETRMWGKKPEVAILVALSSGEWSAPSRVKPGIDPALEAICMRALARSPDDRYATAAEFQRALEEYLESSATRSSARQIAQFVSEQFGDERKRIRETIDVQVRRVASGRSSDAPPMLPVSREDDDDSAPTTSSDPEGAARDATGPKAGGALASNRRRPAVIAVAAGGALAAIAAAIALARSPAVDAPASAPSVANIPSSAAPSSAPSAAPATVHFRARATPPGAQLFLDDAALATNPFDANVARDGRAHHVKAVASGFETHEEVVSFDAPVDVTLALKRAGAPAPHGATPPASGTATIHPAKPKLSLDETDPYAR